MTGISRRRFLGWVSTAGLFGLAGCAGRKARHPKSNPDARVVVLGGGFAGATAAKYLRLFDPLVKITLIERNKFYLSCPGSNEVVANLKKGQKDLLHEYKALTKNYGIELVTGEASGIDVRQRAVTFTDGSKVAYDRLIVSPGIDFRWNAIEGYDEAASLASPHAWKAGPQTTLLRRQIRAMRNGGVVIITVPDNPYRCPPGPYERASLIAHFLSQYKPRSKVLILDSKTSFSKQAAFQQGWKELYPGMIEWISSEKQGHIERIEPERRIVHTEFGKHRANVLNVIPPQKAGRLAEVAGLTDTSGWCPVDPQTFESTQAPKVHVIGDACIAAPMPKSAFAANSQAKVCAAAVLDLLADVEPEPPRLINHCYSFLDPDNAISITGVYGYSNREKSLTALSAGETLPGRDRRQEAEYARNWYEIFMRDVFS